MPAPRRIVLLSVGAGPHDEIEQVLAHPSAASLFAELRRLAEGLPGRLLAGEHLTRLGWVRWLWKGDGVPLAAPAPLRLYKGPRRKRKGAR